MSIPYGIASQAKVWGSASMRVRGQAQQDLYSYVGAYGVELAADEFSGIRDFFPNMSDLRVDVRFREDLSFIPSQDDAKVELFRQDDDLWLVSTGYDAFVSPFFNASAVQVFTACNWNHPDVYNPPGSRFVGIGELMESSCFLETHGDLLRLSNVTFETAKPNSNVARVRDFYKHVSFVCVIDSAVGQVVFASETPSLGDGPPILAPLLEGAYSIPQVDANNIRFEWPKPPSSTSTKARTTSGTSGGNGTAAPPATTRASASARETSGRRRTAARCRAGAARRCTAGAPRQSAPWFRGAPSSLPVRKTSVRRSTAPQSQTCGRSQ